MVFPFLAAGAAILAGGAASAMTGTKSNTQSIINDITTKVVNKSINKVTDELISRNKVNVNTQAIVDFNNQGVMNCGGTMKITASAKTKIQQIASAYKSSETDFVNNLTSVIKEEIEILAAQENKSDWSDVFKRNQANVLNILNKQDIITEQLVENIIKDSLNIETETDNKTVSKVIFNNTGVLTTAGDCEFTAESIVDVISDSLAEKISNNQIINDLTQDLTVSVKSETSQKNISASLAIILICIAILFAIGGGGYFLYNDNQNQRGGNSIQQNLSPMPDSTRKSKLPFYLFLLVTVCFLVSLGIWYYKAIYNSIGYCEDDTEIPIGVVPGGNTSEQKDKCWKGLTADPPKMEKYKDEGGLCNYTQDEFNKYMNEKTGIESGDNWKLDDFKPEWQKCDGKEHDCGFCRNEKPLSKSFFLAIKKTWKSYPAIATYIFLILMIITVIFGK